MASYRQFYNVKQIYAVQNVPQCLTECNTIDQAQGPTGNLSSHIGRIIWAIQLALFYTGVYCI